MEADTIAFSFLFFLEASSACNILIIIFSHFFALHFTFHCLPYSCLSIIGTCKHCITCSCSRRRVAEDVQHGWWTTCSLNRPAPGARLVQPNHSQPGLTMPSPSDVTTHIQLIILISPACRLAFCSPINFKYASEPTTTLHPFCHHNHHSNLSKR